MHKNWVAQEWMENAKQANNSHYLEAVQTLSSENQRIQGWFWVVWSKILNNLKCKFSLGCNLVVVQTLSSEKQRIQGWFWAVWCKILNNLILKCKIGLGCDLEAGKTRVVKNKEFKADFERFDPKF